MDLYSKIRLFVKYLVSLLLTHLLLVYYSQYIEESWKEINNLK